MPVDEAMLVAADRNMAVAWDRLLASAPRPGRIEDGGEGLLLLSSGLPVSLFNPAFVSAPPADPEATVARIVEHYRPLTPAFALYFRDAVAPGLADACLAAGLIEHWQPPLMVLDPIPEAAPPPPPAAAGLSIAPLDAGNVEGYVQAMCAGFGMPLEIGRVMFGANLLGLEGFTGFVGSIDGAAVSTSAVFVVDGIAGVYNVATVPEHRGRGIGEALTWEASMAGRRGGAAVAILQASEQGEPVYTRMGYSTPARYRQFEPAPA